MKVKNNMIKNIKNGKMLSNVHCCIKKLNDINIYLNKKYLDIYIFIYNVSCYKYTCTTNCFNSSFSSFTKKFSFNNNRLIW